MGSNGGAADDVEGPDPADESPIPPGPDRSLAPQPGQAGPPAHDDQAGDPTPEQAPQTQQ